ncbi:heme ABC transporter ATP-binding protein/permease CydC [Paraferrimonas haliotis]|uniref:Glutathione/L-cysteine transport system ATP-binding/permease protein CydC n=1 Tax=Paraferrimonas haliotis TaxID=2013866 RepID=A0AA37TPL5_9GAMM|nr:cysteine/glutathione ABC transporter ATP-binding protein/permease CydC [Paraferrimonas haliotis]GLS84583.1 cysteine/glutathione ABC transporter ATP-binding protein/permease CydC [Paraferrimonas haliotis]
MKALMPFVRLFARHWGWMSLGLLLSLLTLVMAIGLLSLSGWFISASAVAGLTVATSQAFNYLIPAGGVRGLSIGRTAARYGERLVTHNATFKLLTEMRVWLWNKLLPLSIGQLTRYRQADLLNRLVSDIDTLDHLYLRLLTPMLASLSVILLLGGFLAIFDATAAWFLCCLLLSLWLLLPPLFYWLGKRPGEATLQAKQAFRIRSIELVSHASEARVFGYQQRLQQQLNDAQDVLLNNQAKLAKITGLSQAVIIVASAVAVFGVIAIASQSVMSSTYSGPILALLVFATMASFEAMLPVAGAFQYLSATIKAAVRVSDVVEQQPMIEYQGHEQLNVNRETAIEFQNLAFQYPQQDNPVFVNLDMKVALKERVGIIGPSGIGKSTLLALINRQWQPSDGQIKVFDTPLEQIQETSLRQNLVTIGQVVHLFNATLAENLRIAADVNDEKLVEVLKAVGLDSLLQQPQPLEQWLGEGGRTLSGGEQRRIEIARALLTGAPIWLLDEPTEGLDSDTEQQILHLLTELPYQPTMLWVSHRPQHEQYFDRVINIGEFQSK